jgi:hypothetical protein
MAMAAHWDWAIRQVLAEDTISHVSVLTDRMLFLPGALQAVVDVVERFPDDIVTYSHDGLGDLDSPVSLWQAPWTGRMVRVPSRLLLELAARCMLDELEAVLPLLLNTVVPRPRLEAVAAAYGSVCADVISPDYGFAFRALTLTDDILYFDRALMLSYAQDRSNGASGARGLPNKDHADFVATVGPLSYAAPIPGLGTPANAIVHEYCVVRANDLTLPEVHMERYVELLRSEMSRMSDGPTRQAMEEALQPHPIQPATSGTMTGARKHARRAVRAVRSPSRVWRVLFPHGRSEEETDFFVTTWPDRERAIEAAQHRRPAHHGRTAIERAAEPFDRFRITRV